MRSHTIHPRMTPARRAYLLMVRASEPYEPRHGVVANHCLVLGWVESVVWYKGNLVRWDSVPLEDRYATEWAGQRLTDKGRAAMLGEGTEP